MKVHTSYAWINVVMFAHNYLTGEIRKPWPIIGVGVDGELGFGVAGVGSSSGQRS